MRLYPSKLEKRFARPPLWPLVAASVAFALGFGLYWVPPYLVLLLFLAAAVTVIFLAKPEVAIGLLLLFRPALEVFGDFYLPTPFGDILNPAGIVTLALIAGVMVWILDRRIDLFQLPASRPFLLFLAFGMLSVFISPVVGAAIGEWLRLASYYLLYVFVRLTTRSARQMRGLMAIIALSSIVPIAVGFLQMARGQTKVIYGISQVQSVFAHMNIYGMYLVMVSLGALMALQASTRRSHRWAYGALLGLALVSLVSTYARTAWVGLVIGIAAIGALEYRRWLLWLPPALVSMWLWVPNVRERIMLAFASMDVRENSLVSRWLRWQEALQLFRASPIIGNGLRSYSALSARLSHKLDVYGGVGVHNTYIQLLAENGVLGLGSYLWLHVVLLNQAWRALQTVRSPRLRPAVLAFIGMLLAALAMGLVDNLLSTPVVQWYLWTFAALSGCAIELQRAQDQADVDREEPTCA